MKGTRRFRIVFFAVLWGMLLSCATGLSQDRSHASVGLFYNADEYDRLMHGDDVLMSYTRAIEENRATRVVLSPRQTQEQTAKALDSIDALLIPGGADIDPKFYKEERHPRLEEPVDAGFDGYELAGIRRAEARGIPILGICRGLQLLNVGAGGTLYQDLPSELGTKVTHRISDGQGRAVRCVHLITISPGSILNEVFKTDRLEVNSYHHQGVLREGEGFEVTARTEDGLAEGIENRRSHILAVQFHPEKDRKANPLFNTIFTYFIGQALATKSGAGAAAVPAAERSRAY
jgi:putative glutamine amidotransferase